jgi:RHS repeat-associated protein
VVTCHGCYDGLYRGIARIVKDGDNWDRTDYYYNESWQVLEERFADDVSTQNKGTPATAVSVQWLWDIRYVDSPVLRWRDTDGNPQTGDYGLEETLYYCNDANMNVTALVDGATGEVVERYMYDPYGRVTVYEPDWSDTVAWEDSVKNELLFAGYRFDAETGLYHVRNRQYHPTLGRWLQRDPAGYVDGVSLYQYVAANPGRYRDPNGLDFSEAAEFAGNAVGGFLEGVTPMDLPPPADQNAANGRNAGRGAATAAGAYLAAQGGAETAAGGAAMAAGAAAALAGAKAGGGAGTAVAPGPGTAVGAVAGATPGAALARAGATTAIWGLLRLLWGIYILHRTANLGPATPPKPQSTPPKTQNACEGSSLAPNNAAQMKKLSPGEIKKLKDKGIDPHNLKPNSKYDLFKDKDGNIYVKPKDGSGPGDPTGININAL